MTGEITGSRRRSGRGGKADILVWYENEEIRTAREYLGWGCAVAESVFDENDVEGWSPGPGEEDG